MVYYRKDILDKDGSSRRRRGTTTSRSPQKYNGQDLNGDGEPDYGSCIAKKKGAQSYWWIISLAGGLLQAKGTGEGAFFDTTTMNPLFGQNEAMTQGPRDLREDRRLRSARRAQHGRRRHRAACSRPGAAP